MQATQCQPKVVMFSHMHTYKTVKPINEQAIKILFW